MAKICPTLNNQKNSVFDVDEDDDEEEERQIVEVPNNMEADTA